MTFKCQHSNCFSGKLEVILNIESFHLYILLCNIHILYTYSFIYTKIVEFETPEFAAEFYYAAHKYNSNDALEFIKAYMLKELSPENSTVFYDIAYLYDNIKLKEACLKVSSIFESFLYVKH